MRASDCTLYNCTVVANSSLGCGGGLLGGTARNTLLAFNSGALLVSQGGTFSGDEPHYLLICHSLLRDGDFELTNNYEHRDYAGYMMFEGKIAAHVVPGAEPGSRYSFHSPGVPFLMLTFYALGVLFKGRALDG